MARMPGAAWVGPHHDNGLMSRYDIVCLHTIVGYAPAHAAQFSTNAAGKKFQSRDTKYRSAANLNGNHRVIAIENEDHGSAFGRWNVNDGHAVPAFTDQQIEAIAQICAWAHKVHGIPLVACPNSKPGSRGIAYHRQGIDGNWSGYAYGGRVSGGETWTNHRGKVCPGDRRISQIPQIIARAKQIAGITKEDWFDMVTKAELEEILDERLNNAIVKHTDKNVAWHLRLLGSPRAIGEEGSDFYRNWTPPSYWAWAYGHAYHLRGEVRQVLEAVQANSAAISSLATVVKAHAGEAGNEELKAAAQQLTDAADKLSNLPLATALVLDGEEEEGDPKA